MFATTVTQHPVGGPAREETDLMPDSVLLSCGELADRCATRNIAFATGCGVRVDVNVTKLIPEKIPKHLVVFRKPHGVHHKRTRRSVLSQQLLVEPALPLLVVDPQSGI